MDARTNTPMGGIESMAEWDGQWYASSPRFPIRPADARYFETLPRLGDPALPRMQVVLGEDKALALVPEAPRRGAGKPDTGEVGDEAAYLLGRLEQAWPEPLWTKEVCRPGDDYRADRAMLDMLVEQRLVTCEVVAKGTKRGMRWGLAAAPDATPDDTI